jgi:hypothetical protein
LEERRDLGFLTSILSPLTSVLSEAEANVSIFLITLHAPLSTVLNRTLSRSFSRLLPTTYNVQPTTVLTAREVELARRYRYYARIL